VSRWQTLKWQVLLRRVPHCLLSWRFLLPGQGPAVALPRKVLFGAWPKLPRWQWGVIFLYSTLLWWLFRGWFMLVRSLKRQGRRISESEGVGMGRQLAGLLLATFAHGIAPRDYYRYSLYRFPERRWLHFVYEQELPHWHWLMSPQLGAESIRLMTDKHAFAEAMVGQSIATVETVAKWPQGEDVSDQQLFRGRSLFLKPVCGSRAQGGMKLIYLTGDEKYTLQTSDQTIGARAEILASVQSAISTSDYLVQPLLNNAPELAQLCGSDSAATLRVISAWVDGEPTVLFANLELPPKQLGGQVQMAAIDVDSGCISAVHASATEALKEMIGRSIPQWSEVMDLCIRAHHHFEDLNTIGWDVVIDENGVKLLEGNINWGVAAHQIIVGKPALKSELIQAYR